ncbi:MAG: crossover junction endodeoxyribonuclease RuvC [Weeksellaceae bacterium]
MNILSIDPGVEKVGYAIFAKNDRDYTLVTSDLIKTSRKLTHGKRLQEIFDHLVMIRDQYNVEEVAMERLFFTKNTTTAIPVAQAQGVIELLAAQKAIPVAYLTPSEIKASITGYGNADKKAVHKMLEISLEQKLVVKDDDEADAIACGLAYCLINR